MPDKLTTYVQLAEDTTRAIMHSHETWTAFLSTAARMYKYAYNDQLMIHAQRPAATACAPYEVWNQKMSRYVRRGSKGIALLDSSGDTVALPTISMTSMLRWAKSGRRRPFAACCGMLSIPDGCT